MDEPLAVNNYDRDSSFRLGRKQLFHFRPSFKGLAFIPSPQARPSPVFRFFILSFPPLF